MNFNIQLQRNLLLLARCCSIYICLRQKLMLAFDTVYFNIHVSLKYYCSITYAHGILLTCCDVMLNDVPE